MKKIITGKFMTCLGPEYRIWDNFVNVLNAYELHKPKLENVEILKINMVKVKQKLILV